VDADQVRVKVLRMAIEARKPLVKAVATAKEAQEILRVSATRPDLLILEEASESNNLDSLLAAALRLNPKPAVIQILVRSGSKHDDLKRVLEAKKKADDCLLFPTDIATIQDTVEGLLNSRASPLSSQVRMGSMIGPGDTMQQVFRRMLKAAATEGPVLLEGAVGVGKHSAAREIHRHSSRTAGRFGAVRCADRDEQELASHLFGYEKDAWPWASQARDGLIKGLDQGTLYLERVGNLSQRLQGDLVRLLDEQSYLPFRGHKPLRADVRLIVSHTESLSMVLEKGLFLPELFYRLSANRIEIPPLSSRRPDIPPLVHAFLAELEVQISGEALDVLLNYDWPGNLDELQSVLSSGAKWCERQRIEVEDLPGDVMQGAKDSGRNHLYYPPVPPEAAERAD